MEKKEDVNSVNIKDEIRIFLAADPIYRGLLPKDFTDDFGLVDSGVLDSIGIFNLVNYLEKTYKLKIEAEDLSETNFKTLNAIVDFVQSRC